MLPRGLNPCRFGRQSIDHAELGREERINLQSGREQKIENVTMSQKIRRMHRLRSEHVRGGYERRIFIEQLRYATLVSGPRGHDDSIDAHTFCVFHFPVRNATTATIARIESAIGIDQNTPFGPSANLNESTQASGMRSSQ